MEDNKKVSLVSTVLFTVCGVLTLDSFVAPAMIGVSAISVWIIAAVVFLYPTGFCRPSSAAASRTTAAL